VKYKEKHLPNGNLEELGIALTDSDLNGVQKKQLENLLLCYADVFSKGKRDIGKYSEGVQHQIPCST